MIFFNAYVAEFKKIIFTVDDFTQFQIYRFEVKNGDKSIGINSYSISENTIELILSENINIKKECYVYYESKSIKAIYSRLYKTSEFNDRYYHDITLGAIYNKNFTVFRVWSPAATSIYLLLYDNSEPVPNENPKKYKMKENNGVWSALVKGNIKNSFYTYQVKVYNNLNEAVDPYTRAVGINGLRGAIIDFEETNPKNFDKDISPQIKEYTDAILYELSIRDISSHPDSGVFNKGKFLALTEDNTKSSKNLSTALAHIKDLGVTHVQIMPSFDFSYKSIDEKSATKYNWGYDPQNYNVPEGYYSTDPYNPAVRIIEFKRMIQHLHRNGICVNMDVVFNHCAGENDNNFEKIFPGYYFRLHEDGSLVKGSGCENDTASEHSMMRKFIIDSVIYWAHEYHIDGFRFDLMGLHDITTMNIIRQKLDKLDRTIMVYGEGWNLNSTLPEGLKAAQINAHRIPHIGHFNDVIRDAIRGSIFAIQDKGFVSGKDGMEDSIKKCVTGSIKYSDRIKGMFSTPDQSINYVCAHDNHTLWDKLELSTNYETIDDLKNMQKLANAIVLTCQGIPFLHSGVEFCRTKGHIENSFKSPDTVNRMDWDRKAQFLDVYTYYKGIITLRKEHSAFRMNDPEHIKNSLEFFSYVPQKVVAFMLKDYANGDIWKDILVVYNANKYNVTINIPYGTWHLVTDKFTSGVETIKIITSDTLEVSSISMSVLYRM